MRTPFHASVLMFAAMSFGMNFGAVVAVGYHSVISPWLKSTRTSTVCSAPDGA